MPQPLSPSMLAHFAGLEDPRQHAKVLYPLVGHCQVNPGWCLQGRQAKLAR